MRYTLLFLGQSPWNCVAFLHKCRWFSSLAKRKFLPLSKLGEPAFLVLSGQDCDLVESPAGLVHLLQGQTVVVISYLNSHRIHCLVTLFTFLF